MAAMARPRRIRTLGLAGVVLAVLFGLFLGASGFTFYTAKGWSYMSNDPTVCVNCHIMRDQYDSWQKSSHHAFAACNDCHVPQDFLGKYWTKAEHGARHSWGFTFQNFHEPIQIKDSSLAAVQGNCLRCHQALVSEITKHSDVRGDVRNCIRCHASVGHSANP